jgi:hypothetical protein
MSQSRPASRPREKKVCKNLPGPRSSYEGTNLRAPDFLQPPESIPRFTKGTPLPTLRSLALLLLTTPSLAAQTAPNPATPKRPAAPTVKPAAEAPLPITRVALYKNGVGFFEHSGHVTGDQSVTIDFTTAQLNDVLQSLTAIDLNGGRISGAGYNSTTPLDQQLQALSLGLPAKTTISELFESLRGSRLEIVGSGTPFTGRLLSCEMHKTAATKDSNMLEGRFLTVAAESGEIRTFQLTPALTVRLLDTHTDLTQYLKVLDSNRDQGLRHLTLTDNGTGARELHVSYISEVPVWKSTYRILFTDSTTTNAATLQGWSVVDNTTGTDWINVHLDLIAGAPQSFIQPISTPYYARRPEIPLPTEAELSPQTHQSGEDAPPPPAVGASGALNNLERFTGGQLPPRQNAPRATGVAMGNGYGVGAAGGVMRGQSATVNVTATNGNLQTLNATVGEGMSEYQALANASLAPQTTSTSFDDFFQYTLTDPITIRKNESALVPILQTRLPIERVTLWSQQEPVALRALWITNSSSLTLDRGSFSIVENGSFGGEGLLDPIHPNEKRLLSYAADQAVRVTISGSKYTSRVNRLQIAKGVLTETSIDVAEQTYDVRNAAPDPRTIIIEHPIRQGWTLDSDPKPAETTPTAYRFRVAAKPSETVHLHVGERHTNYQYIRLVDRSEDQLILMLKGASASPATLAALQPVFDAHHAVQALDDEIRTRQTEIVNITKDQDRLRENMKALKGSPEEKALLTRYTGELNTQEDRLAALNKEIADLQLKRTAAQSDYDAKLNSLTLDETI